MSELRRYTPPIERELSARRRLVVTGMGAITPLGLDVQSTWNRLAAGESGFTSQTIDGINASVFGQVNDFDPAVAFEGLLDPKDARRLARPVQFATAASLEALRQAGLLTDDMTLSRNVDPDRFGVQIGTGMGGAAGFIDVHNQMKSGRGRVLPTEILRVLIERVSSVPSRVMGLRGPIMTPSAACATGNAAIISGMQQLLLNDADIMLVGGVESSLNPESMKMFDAMPALTREANPAVASRPFDTARDGFVMSEGAGVLVIETEEHAARRGAEPLAYFGGYGMTADAFNDVAPSGEGAERAMARALKGMDRENARIYINAHGTATKEGDPVEIEAVKRVVGTDDIVISSTKGAMGHTLGGAGAIETIFCVQALRTGIAPPTVHHEETMPEARGLNIVPNQAQQIRPDIAMNNSFGFGGFNGVVTVYKAS